MENNEKCPLKTSKEWKILATQLGEDKAFATWMAFGEDYPHTLMTTSALKKELGLSKNSSSLQIALLAKRLEKYNKDNGTSHRFTKKQVGQADLYVPELQIDYLPVLKSYEDPQSAAVEYKTYGVNPVEGTDIYMGDEALRAQEEREYGIDMDDVDVLLGKKSKLIKVEDQPDKYKYQFARSESNYEYSPNIPMDVQVKITNFLTGVVLDMLNVRLVDDNKVQVFVPTKIGKAMFVRNNLDEALAALIQKHKVTPLTGPDLVMANLLRHVLHDDGVNVYRKFEAAIMRQLQARGYKFTKGGEAFLRADGLPTEDSTAPDADGEPENTELIQSADVTGRSNVMEDSLTIPNKKTMSTILRTFLSAIRSKKASVIALAEGFNKFDSEYVNEDIVIKAINAATVGYATLSGMLAALRDTAKLLPKDRSWLADVADKLVTAPAEIQSQFVSKFNQQQAVFLVHRFDKKPRVVTTFVNEDGQKNPIFAIGTDERTIYEYNGKVLDTNRFEAATNLKDKAKEDFYASRNLPSTDVVPDEVKAKLAHSYLFFKKAVSDYMQKNDTGELQTDNKGKDTGNIDPDKLPRMKAHLNLLLKGVNIEMSDEALTRFLQGRLPKSDKKWNFLNNELDPNSVFNSTSGILFHIFNQFANPKHEVTITDIFGNSGAIALFNLEAMFQEFYYNTSVTNGKGEKVWAYSAPNPLSTEYYNIVGDLKSGNWSHLDPILNDPYRSKSYLLGLVSGMDDEQKRQFLENFKYGIMNTLKSGARDGKDLADLERREFILTQIVALTSAPTKDGQGRTWSHKFLTTASDKGTMYQIQTPDFAIELNKENKPVVGDRTIQRFYDYFLGEYDRAMAYQNSSPEDKATYDSIETFEPMLFYHFPSLNMKKDNPMWKDGKLQDMTEEIEDFVKDQLGQQVKADVELTRSKWEQLGLTKDGLIAARFGDAYRRKISSRVSLNDEIARLKKERYQLDRDAATYFPEELLAKQKELEKAISVAMENSDKNLSEYLIYEYAINYHMHNIEMHMVFLGDPADFIKRGSADATELLPSSKALKISVTKTQTGEPLADSNNPADWKRYIDAIRDNLSKRMAGIQASGMVGNIPESNKTANTVVLVDNPVASKILKEYVNSFANKKDAAKFSRIDHMDGQEFITAEEDLLMKMQFGKLSKGKYKTLLAKVQGANEDLETLGYIQDKNKFTDKEKLIAQAQKPVMFAQIPIKIGKYTKYKTTYYKTSAFGLYPQLTSGMEIDNIRKSIYDLGKNGTKVDRLVMKSAAKTGVKAPIDGVFNQAPNGKVSIDPAPLDALTTDNIDFVPREFLRIQLEIPYDPDKENIRVASQQIVLIFNEILDVEFEGKSVSYFLKDEFGGKSVKGSELKALHEKVYKELLDLSKEQVLKQIGARLGNDGTYYFKSTEKLREMLYKQAIDLGFEMPALDGLELSADKKNFKIPLSFSSNADRYEKLLLSLIKKMVLQKMHGRSLILATETGFVPKKDNVMEGKEARDFIDANEESIVFMEHDPATDSGYDRSVGLKPSRRDPNNPDNILPAQVLISFKYKDNEGNLLDLSQFIKTDPISKIKTIDLSKMDKDILKLVGIRIPVQGHPSMGTIEVVGFLPELAADLIIAPMDFTKIFGSDFDIDKLYAYMYNYQQASDGSLRRYKKLVKPNETALDEHEGDFTDVLEGIEEEDDTPDKKILQNKLQDIYHAILSNPTVWLKSTIGINEGRLNQLSDSIKDFRTRETTTTFFSPSSEQNKVDEYYENRAGKVGVSIFSANNTFATMIEGKNIRLAKFEDIGEGKPRKVDNPLKIVSNDDNVIHNFVELSGKKGFNRIISAYQSGSVDNANLKILDWINCNQITMGVSSVMAMLADDSLTHNIVDEKTDSSGKITASNVRVPILNEDFIVYFLGQDSVMEYIKRLSMGNDSISGYDATFKQTALTEILEEIEVKIKASIGDEFSKRVTFFPGFSQSELKKHLFLPDPTNVDYLVYQYAVLAKFAELQQNSDDVRTLQYLVNANSKGTTGSLDEALYKKRRFSQILKDSPVGEGKVGLSTLFNVENLFINPDGSDTLVGKIANMGIEMPIRLFADTHILSTGSVVANNMIEKISLVTQKDFANYSYKFGRKVNKSLLSYMQSDLRFKVQSPDMMSISAQKALLLKGTETVGSLADDITAFKATQAYKDQDLLKPLFESLKIRTNDDGQKFVEFQAYTGLINPIEEIIQAMKYLRVHNYPLFEKLVQYTLLMQFSNSPVSLRQFIAPYYLQGIGVADRYRIIADEGLDRNGLVDLLKKSAYGGPFVPRFVEQFLQHNPDEAMELDEHDVNFVTENYSRVRGDITSKFTVDVTTTKGGKYMMPDSTKKDNPAIDTLAIPYLSIFDRKADKWRLYKVSTDRDPKALSRKVYKEIPLLGSYNLDEYEYDAQGTVSSLISKNNIKLSNVTVDTPESITPTDYKSAMEEADKHYVIAQNFFNGYRPNNAPDQIHSIRPELITKYGSRVSTMQLVETGDRTRSTRKQNWMDSNNPQVGQYRWQAREVRDKDTGKVIGYVNKVLTVITAVYNSEDPRFQGNWGKEGWVDANFEFVKDYAGAIEFRVVKEEEFGAKYLYNPELPAIDIWSTNKNPFDKLSNIHNPNVKFGEKVFKTVEHLYQWKKAMFHGDVVKANEIADALTGWDAQKLGQQVNMGTASTKFYEGDIKPDANTIFVFGSNPVGVNGNPEKGTGGAALVALQQFGVKQGEKMDNRLAVSGKAYGLTTVTGPGKQLSMTPEEITAGIKKLYQVARENPGKDFKVAYRNTTEKSLNGYTGLQMIEMFNNAGERPSNIIFSKEWVNTSKLSQDSVKSGWESVKVKELEGAMRMAFEQNSAARKLLIATGDAKLTHVKGGPFWAVEFSRILMEIRKELHLKSDDRPLTMMSQFIDHSGGADTSDTDWDIIGRDEFGVTEFRHYREPASARVLPSVPGEVDSLVLKGRGVKSVDLEEKDFPGVYAEGQQKATIAARQMGRIEETHQSRSHYIIRNWAQVKYADGIFAIGSIIEVGTDLGNGKTAKIKQVSGGTGYAVQMAINEKKLVYVYDASKDSWFTWDPSANNYAGDFVPCDVPVLTKNFAGIGTRKTTYKEKNLRAIRAVYKKTQESLSTTLNPTKVELETDTLGRGIVSLPYGVVKVETNPTDEETLGLLDVLMPQLSKQAYKENIGTKANWMFMYGLRWARVEPGAKPVDIDSYSGKDKTNAEIARLTAAGLRKSDKFIYAYHELDQNGKELPSLDVLQPFIARMENAMGMSMADYDSAIVNIYLPGESIATHRDTTESMQARKYPVVVYTIGNDSGLTIYENRKNPGKLSTANDTPVPMATKNGTVYAFGVDGKGRFEVAHETPKGLDRPMNMPPITLPDGRVVTNYTITVTLRRAQDLAPWTPEAPPELLKAGKTKEAAIVTGVPIAPVFNNAAGQTGSLLDTYFGINMKSESESGEAKVNKILSATASEQNLTNPYFKELAQFMLDVNAKTGFLNGIRFRVDTDPRAEDHYDHISHTVVIRSGHSMDELPNVLLHELIHAAQSGGLLLGEAGQQLQIRVNRLIAAMETDENLQKGINHYGLAGFTGKNAAGEEQAIDIGYLRDKLAAIRAGNVLVTYSSEEERQLLNPLVDFFEFTAMTIGDRGVQEFMNSIDYQDYPGDTTKSMFGRLKDIVASFFDKLARMLGISVRDRSMLRAAMDAAMEALDVPGNKSVIYKWYGQHMEMVLDENNIAIDVKGYKGKPADKQKIMDAYNKDPNFDVQKGVSTKVTGDPLPNTGIKVVGEKDIVLPFGANPNNLPIFETAETIYLMNNGQQKAYDDIKGFILERMANPPHVNLDSKEKFTDNALDRAYSDIFPKAMWENMYGLIGEGGTGKTTVIKKILKDTYNELKAKNKYASFNVHFGVPTHTAATVLQESLGVGSEATKTGGVDTIASLTARKEIKTHQNGTETLELISELAYVTEIKKNIRTPLSSYDVIVFDESSMTSKQHIRDLLLRFKQEQEAGFGGTMPVMIFMGDYRQLPDIADDKESLEQEGAISSTLFTHRDKFTELSEIMRSSSKDLHDIFHSVGNQIDLRRNAFMAGKPVPKLDLSEYNALTSKSSENVLVVNDQKGVIDDYTTYLMENNNPYGMFWVHYNNLNHPRTKYLFSEIRKAYFDKLKAAGLVPANQVMKDTLQKYDYVQFTGSTEVETNHVVLGGDQKDLTQGTIKPQARFKLIDTSEEDTTLDELIKGPLSKYFTEAVAVKLGVLHLYSRQNTTRGFKYLKDIKVKTEWVKSVNKWGKPVNNVKLVFTQDGKVVYTTPIIPGGEYMQNRGDIAQYFSDVDKLFKPSYIGSSHTAQGNSIETVIVGDANIQENLQVVNPKDISSSLYTALTRASKKLIILKAAGTRIQPNQPAFKPNVPTISKLVGVSPFRGKAKAPQDTEIPEKISFEYLRSIKEAISKERATVNKAFKDGEITEAQRDEKFKEISFKQQRVQTMLDERDKNGFNLIDFYNDSVKDLIAAEKLFYSAPVLSMEEYSQIALTVRYYKTLYSRIQAAYDGREEYVTNELRNKVLAYNKRATNLETDLIDAGSKAYIAQYNKETGMNRTVSQIQQTLKSEWARNNFISLVQSKNSLARTIGRLVDEMVSKTTSSLDEHQLEDTKQADKFLAHFDFPDITEVERFQDEFGIWKTHKNFISRYKGDYFRTRDRIFAEAKSKYFDPKNRAEAITRGLAKVSHTIDLRYLAWDEYNKEMALYKGEETPRLKSGAKATYEKHLLDYYNEQFSEYSPEYIKERVEKIIEDAHEEIERYKTDKKNHEEYLDTLDLPEEEKRIEMMQWLVYNSPFIILNENHTLNKSLGAYKDWAIDDAAKEAKDSTWTDRRSGELVTGKSFIHHKLRKDRGDSYITKLANRKIDGKLTGFYNDRYLEMEQESYEKNRRKKAFIDAGDQASADKLDEVPTLYEFHKWVTDRQKYYLAAIPYFLRENIRFNSMLDVEKSVTDDLESKKAKAMKVFGPNFSSWDASMDNLKSFWIMPELATIAWDNVVKAVSEKARESDIKRIDFIRGEERKNFNPGRLGNTLNDLGLGDLKTDSLRAYLSAMRTMSVTYKIKNEAESMIRFGEFLFDEIKPVDDTKFSKTTSESDLVKWTVDNKLYDEDRLYAYDTQADSTTKMFGVIAPIWKLTKQERDKFRELTRRMEELKILERTPGLYAHELQKIGVEKNKIDSALKRLTRVANAKTGHDVFAKFIRLGAMGYAIFGRFVDLLQSTILGGLREAYDGRIYGINSYRKSLGYVSGLYMPKVAGSITTVAGALTLNPVVFGLGISARLVAGAINQNVLRLEHRKLTEVMKKMGALEFYHTVSDDEIVSNTVKKGMGEEILDTAKLLNPYELTQEIEQINKSVPALAVMFETTIKNKAGEDKNLYDAFIINDAGELAWNEVEFGSQKDAGYDWVTGGKMRKVKANVRTVTINANGDYSKEHTIMMDATNRGKALIILRRFMAQWMQSRISDTYVDENTGLEYMGSMYSLYHQAVNIAKTGSRDKTAYVMAANRQAIVGVIYTSAILVAATAIAFAAGDDDDKEEDDKVTAVLFFINNMLSRTFQDNIILIDPTVVMKRSFSGIHPYISFLLNAGGAGKAGWKAMMGDDTMSHSELTANGLSILDYKIPTGINPKTGKLRYKTHRTYPDVSRFGYKLSKVFPVINQIQSLPKKARPFKTGNASYGIKEFLDPEE